MFATFHISDLFSGTLNPLRVVLTLLIALAVGGFLYLIYKKTFAGVVYSRSFNISLILLTMVSALVLMLISSNLTLSLGMVGALSIVRFRTAIKDPIDTVFMFWAVGEGLALGAGFVDVGLIGALVIGVVMVVISGAKGSGTAPYLLILHYDERASQQIKGLVKQLQIALHKIPCAEAAAVLAYQALGLCKLLVQNNVEVLNELIDAEPCPDEIRSTLRLPG